MTPLDRCLSLAIDRIYAELDTCTDKRKRRWLRRRLRVLERKIWGKDGG